MNYNDNYKMNQQKYLYSIKGQIPTTNLNTYPSPLINDNIISKVNGFSQNSNKNLKQIGYNPPLSNTIRIQNIYNPVSTVPSSNMKNQIFSMNNMNIIQAQQMNTTNQNISPIGNNNLINQTYSIYNPAIQSTNLINYGNNPNEKLNINMIHQKPIQIINYNQLPATNNIIQIISPKIISYNPNMNVKPNNEIKSQKKDEVSTGHKQIDINIAFKAMKSICKITIHYYNEIRFGTGFFMEISDSLKFLITNYHVLNPQLINKNIQIELFNKKVIILNLDEYKVIYMKKPKDISAIKLKDSDDIYKDIEFLNYDLNYLKYGYKIYNNIDVFSGNNSKFASGKIFNINDYEFDHNIDTYEGSSGCPIILNNNNINLLQVIGIHKNGDEKNKINGGTFIGELINEINKNFNNNIRNTDNNYIIAEIYITDENINNNIRIINSLEESQINKDLDKIIIGKNEKEIKKCKIKINDELIPFNYFHKFKNKGLHVIKYKFKYNLTNINFMFCECDSLTNINLSNFNTQNVINMEYICFLIALL